MANQVIGLLRLAARPSNSIRAKSAFQRLSVQPQEFIPLQNSARRSYSTSPIQPDLSPLPPPHSTPPHHSDLRSQFNSQSSQPPPPPPKRPTRPYVYALVFTIIGLTAGQYVRYVIAPPPLPVPESADDIALSAYIRSRAEKLPIVESLTNDPSWRTWDAYAAFSAEQKAHRLTTDLLNGSRGIGAYQKIFYHEETGELISVVWCGGALAGFPGVVHGGLIATLLDESMGRGAIKSIGGKPMVTANLELDYRKPTVTNGFYIIRTIPKAEGSTDRKVWMTGRMETLTGVICVEAKALFINPKWMNLKIMGDEF